jgi:arylsulfatase A-like enzyme
MAWHEEGYSNLPESFISPLSAFRWTVRYHNLIIGGCEAEYKGGDPAPGRVESADMKVLVLAARGLQTAYMGCYGNPWIATPNLDALAASGIVFDQHFADRADANGARRTWRDGRHHLPDPSYSEPPADGNADLIEQLGKRGVATCVVLDDSRPVESGFEAGWKKVEHAASFEGVLEGAGAALNRLARRDDWLLWVDLAVLLPPWDTPEEFLAPYFAEEQANDPEEDEEEEEEEVEEEMEEEEPFTPISDPILGPFDPTDEMLFARLQSSYAAAVTRLDEGVGRLLERLGDLDGAEDTLVVWTADCGQALGEHGAVGAAIPSAHAETVHLPLILSLPGADEAGRRVGALTQAVDLAPTLADVFEVELSSAQGRTLLPLVYGAAEEIHPYVCSGVQTGDEVEWSLRTSEYALLLPAQADASGARLYIKPDDAYEVNNVVQHHTELAEELERTLRAFVEATPKSGPLETPALPS